MAYIPPHKRHSKYPLRPSPPPVTPVPKFNRKLSWHHPSIINADMGGTIVDADITVYRWLVVGLDDDSCFPSSVHLQPISLEHVDHKREAKFFVIANNNLAKDNDEVRGNIPRSPWESIAEDVWPDVLSACKIVNNEMEEMPTLVARFGHVVFCGNNLLGSESARECQVAEETTLRQLTRFFYSDVPAIYVEKIINEVVPKIGVDFEEDKDVYSIMLSDRLRQNLYISCICNVKEDKTLELYKVYVDPIRHLIVNISCIDKNLDLRLALRSKRTLAAVSDDEMNSIRNLIDLAILDPEEKGGLRWPVGKSSCGDRYRVIGVQHSESKSYKSPSLRLKIRHADRFNFKTATRETAIEIGFELRSIVSDIQDRKIDADSVYNGFKDYLRLIWDHFLQC